MEKWQEVFKGSIPIGKYTTLVTNGEEKGLVITLESENNIIEISFGVVLAYRVFDEGIVLGNLFSKNEIDKYKKDDFKNIIYQIENGEFYKFVDDISSGLNSYLTSKHYIIVTMNYVIEIISEYVPDVKDFVSN